MFKKLIILFFLIALPYNLYLQDTKENSELKLALNLYNDGMFELALEQFKNFTSMYPSSVQVPDAKFYIGLCLFNLSRYEDAKLAFQNFALSYAEHPKAAEAWFKIGEIYIKLNNLSEAAISFERARTFYPKSQIAAEALFLAAKYYFASGENLKARKAINTILLEYKNSEYFYPARLILAEILNTEGNTDLAISEVKKVIETSEKNKPEALFLLSKFYKSLLQFSEAEDLLLQLTRDYKNNKIIDEAFFELGIIYKQTKNFNKAITQFSNLINKSIDKYRKEKILYELASTYLESNDFLNAKETLNKLINDFPTTKYFSEVLFWLGYCNESTKNYKEALSHYDKLISSTQFDFYKAKAYVQASNVAVKLGNIYLAINYLTNYLSTTPQDYNKQEAYIRIANLYKNSLKDYQKARENFEYAINYASEKHNLTKLLYNIAECYESSGDFVSAINNYEYIIKNFPQSIEAKLAKQKIEYIKNYSLKNFQNATIKLSKIVSNIIDKKIDLHFELGEIYFEDFRDYLLAVENYNKFLSNPGSTNLIPEAHFKIALSYDLYSKLDSSYTNLAINNYKIFLDKFPTHPKKEDAIFNLIKLYQAKKDINAIEETLIRFYPTKFKNPDYNEAIQILTELYLEKNETKKAIELLKSSLSSAANEKYYNNLANAYLIENKLDSTIYYLNRQLTFFPNGEFAADAILTLAKIYFRLSKHEEVVEVIKKYTSNFYFLDLPEEIKEMYLKSLIESKNYTESILWIQDFLKKAHTDPFFDKDTVIYKFYLGNSYYKLGNLINAIGNLKEFIAKSDDTVLISEAYFILGEISKINGMPDAATLYYKLAGKFGSQKANRDVADLLFNQEKYSEALVQYENLLKIAEKPEDKKYFLSRVIVSKLKNNDLKTAQENVLQFKKLYPKEKNIIAEFEYEQALVYFRNKDYNTAKKIFQNVSSDYEETIYKPLAEFYLTKIMEINQQTQDAVKRYQTIVTKYPKSEAAYRSLLALGNIYFNSEKFEDAIKYYQEIVNDRDKAGEILKYAITNLIESYESTKLYDAALKLTRDFISSFPNDRSIPDKKIKIGVLFTHLGYYDQAIIHYQTLLDELGVEYESEIRYNLGETYFYKGDYQQAILEFLKIPYIESQSQEIDWTATALYMAGQSYEKLGKYDQAISIYQQIIDRKGIDSKFKAGAQKEIERVKSLIKKGD